MFDLIRQHQRLLMLFLVVLILPAFAFFGISGYDNAFQGDNDVAKVGEMPISAQEFEYARQGQIQNMRRVLGDRFDPTMLDTPSARKELLEQLVDQRVLAVEAQAANVVVPDDTVKNAISANTAFRGENGQFDFDRYKQLIGAQGRSEVQYENQVRGELALQSIPRSVSDTVIVPRAVSRQLVKLSQQKRKLATRLFKAEDFVKDVEVDSTKARTFYDDNHAMFNSAESVKIEYLILSEKALAEKVEVTDSEVSEYYENNAKALYIQPEQRQARHILISAEKDADKESKDKAREKVQGLLERLRGGADFAELAKKESEDPGSAEKGGDLGFFNRETMVKPFTDAAFSLDKDVISDVVETEYGFHIIQVTDTREKQQEPLEKVKDKVKEAIRTQKARQEFLAAAETFSNTAYEEPDSLAPAAEKLKMELKTIEKFQRFGTPDLAPSSPLNNPKFVRAVFAPEAIENKTNIDAVETGENVIVSARVLEHFPSKLQDFEAVEADATSRVRAQRAAELAKEAGSAELARLTEKDKPMDGEVIDGFEEAKSVDRYSSGMLPPAATALFNATPDQFPGVIGVELGASGYMLQQLIAIEDAKDADVDKAVESFGAQAAAASGRQSLESFIDAVKERTPIERNLDRISPVRNDG